MRKGTIKAAVLAAVFIGAVLIFGRFMNDTNEDLTTEMKEATLPVITMYQGDQELNELHGYVTEMDPQSRCHTPDCECGCHFL